MTDKYEDIKYQKTNRQKALTPKKKTAGWCAGCDRCYLTSYAKCPVCGVRNGTYRLKREPLA